MIINVTILFKSIGITRGKALVKNRYVIEIHI